MPDAAGCNAVPATSDTAAHPFRATRARRPARGSLPWTTRARYRRSRGTSLRCRLAFSFPPEFHRLHSHQFAWRTSASSIDPLESKRINTLPRRSASNLRAEQQSTRERAFQMVRRAHRRSPGTDPPGDHRRARPQAAHRALAVLRDRSRADGRPARLIRRPHCSSPGGRGGGWVGWRVTDRGQG